MKISVSSYSFYNAIVAGEMTQFDCVKKAKELGFDAIEFIDLAPHNNMSELDYAKAIKEEAKNVGIEISSYTIAADFLNAFDGDYKKEIERVKNKVDIANELGVKFMRHDATVGYSADKHKSFDEVVGVLAQCCNEVSEYAKQYGIKTMVENHGHFAQDSDRVEKLYTAVNNENFGLLFDMGNFLCVDECPASAAGKLAPYVVYLHAKDFHIKRDFTQQPGEGFFNTRGGNLLRGAIVGHGDVPVMKVLNILKAAKYDGYVSMEFEGLETYKTALSIGLANLKKYLNQAGY